jgi:peptidoglycan hydrolase-like protein with peptidoglycan-binding domain
MIVRHVVVACLALAPLAALPACSDYRSQPRPAAAAEPEVSPGMVRHVQTALQEQGMYKGNIDGMWGPETRGALRSYQQAHGLTANGELTSPTLAALFPPPANAPAPTPLTPPPGPTSDATPTAVGNTTPVAAPPAQ